MGKKFIALILAGALAAVSPAAAFADEKAEVLAEKNAAESRLSAAEDALFALEKEQEELSAQIDAKNSELLDLYVRIDQTNAEIEEADGKVDAQEEAVSATELKLSDAEEDLAEQYEAMKRRIQYFYENAYPLGVFGTLLESGSGESALERLEQFLSLEKADREAMDSYRKSLQDILLLKEKLEEERRVLVEERKKLEERQESLRLQNEELSAEIEALKKNGGDYESQIAEVQSQAESIAALIREKVKRLEEIEAAEEAARKAAEEAARKAAEEAARKAAEEAARKAAEEAARRAAEEAARKAAEEESRRAAAEKARKAAEAAARQAAEEKEAARQAAEKAESEAEAARRRAEEKQAAQEALGRIAAGETSNNASAAAAAQPAGGVSKGQQIVNYACQFIGCPYVWGGSSLTNGCDCSHFVFMVLRDCGVYSGGYMTSGYWPGAGSPVGSLAEARAGDVVCYAGHVAIYDGNGMIVEAKGSAYGITHDRRADCKPIVAIRRFT